jgi:hypothetical protein
VRLHGGLGKMQPGRDGLIGQTESQLLQHLKLAATQWGLRAWAFGLRFELRLSPRLDAKHATLRAAENAKLSRKRPRKRVEEASALRGNGARPEPVKMSAEAPVDGRCGCKEQDG